MTPKLKDPAIALATLRCSAGNSSPNSKNGMQPKPIENPTIYTTRLVSGNHLVTRGKENKKLYAHEIVK